jgi:hypothetical protein
MHPRAERFHAQFRGIDMKIPFGHLREQIDVMAHAQEEFHYALLVYRPVIRRRIDQNSHDIKPLLYRNK